MSHVFRLYFVEEMELISTVFVFQQRNKLII